jgi:hypothetical protein
VLALQVYVHFSELANFFLALSSLLCLPAEALLLPMLCFRVWLQCRCTKSQ